MFDMPMMTKKDAAELVETHNDLCKKNPEDRPVYDSAMMQTLGEALREHKTTPELVAYIIENIFDEQRHEEAMEQVEIGLMLDALKMIAREICENEDKDEK